MFRFFFKLHFTRKRRLKNSSFYIAVPRVGIKTVVDENPLACPTLARERHEILFRRDSSGFLRIVLGDKQRSLAAQRPWSDWPLVVRFYLT